MHRAHYALIGHPLPASASPAMHNAAFAALGIDAEYALRPTPPDPAALAAVAAVAEALRSGELAGVNVTVPHKVVFRALLEDESRLVLKTGAVNTVLVTPAGHLRGENTDVAGFAHVLKALGKADGRGRRAVVLGAGGSARAVVGVLLAGGYAVDVLNRSSGRAAVLVSHLHRHFPGAVLRTGPIDPAAIVAHVRSSAHAAEAAVLVNATSVGAAPDVGASLWPLDVAVPAGITVVDLVANPAETALVRHARASGAAAEGGLEMLVRQAAAAFELWTGVAAPVDVMRRAAEDWAATTTTTTTVSTKTTSTTSTPAAGPTTLASSTKPRASRNGT
ncbi:MAG: shikimate dehydrogenase [Anaerolineae bacterium]